MLNEIRVPHGTKENLGRIFKKSRPFVRKALRGQNSDEISLKIRFTAINHFGGYEVQIVENEKSKTL